MAITGVRLGNNEGIADGLSIGLEIDGDAGADESGLSDSGERVDESVLLDEGAGVAFGLFSIGCDVVGEAARVGNVLGLTVVGIAGLVAEFGCADPDEFSGLFVTCGTRMVGGNETTSGLD